MRPHGLHIIIADIAIFGTMEIDICSEGGAVIATVGINVGAKGYFSLMQHDYVELPFSLREPVEFGIGSYIDLRGVFDDALGGKLAKVYCVTDIQTPTYNTATGGYDYRMRFNAYYWLWNNFIFRYTPEAPGGEASWSLTGNLDMQMGVFLRNLAALGFTYNGQPYTCDIDETVADKSVAMTYDNTRLLDALFSMGSEGNWDCDVWITNNVIHFGRNEAGDAVKIEIGVEAADMTRSESKGTYATRIYAFGSDRNLPENYRPVDESLLVNGVVQKRLMLPAGTPYVDAEPVLTQSKIVESVVVFDDIYPRRIGTLSDVQPVQRKYEDADIGENDNDGDEPQEPETFTAYQYKDTGLAFKEEYMLPGKELRIVFQSGNLNGMDFGVIFEPEDTEKGNQIWEIVANEDYGRLLPDETLKPENGDEYILYGFNIQLVSDQYVYDAEQELLQRARQYVEKSKVDDGTYTVPLYSHWVKADQLHRTFDAGQRIRLVNPGLFPAEGRTSRVIGWEMALDYPYDTPTYTLGESTRYSRMGDMEAKLDTLTYKRTNYQGSGGRGVYIIRTNDSTPAADSNVFSALRSLATFLRKDRADSTKYLLSMLGGAIFGKDGFASGLAGFGARIDNGGNGEMESLTLRRFLETPELRYNRVSITIGDKWRAPGLGIIDTVEVDTVSGEDGSQTLQDTGTVTLHLENGEPGAVAVGDICMGIFHDWETPGNNAAADLDDGNGNREYAGFCTVYFTVTEILDTATNGKFRYRLRETSQSWAKQHHPVSQMHFVAYGSFTNTARQSSVYETRTYTRMLVRQNTWEIGKNNIALQWGDLSNLSVFGLDMTGYSAYLNNIYMTGTIEQTGGAGSPYRLEATISDGDIYFHEEKPKTIVCKVMREWSDKTAEVEAWGITRNSGDSVADAEWNAGSKAAAFDGTIVLDYSDLGGGADEGTEFTMRAEMPDGESAYTSLTLRVMPVGTPTYWLIVQGGQFLRESDFILSKVDEPGEKFAPVVVDAYMQTGSEITKFDSDTQLPTDMSMASHIEHSFLYPEEPYVPGDTYYYPKKFAEGGKAVFTLYKGDNTVATTEVTVISDGSPGKDAETYELIPSVSAIKIPITNPGSDRIVLKAYKITGTERSDNLLDLHGGYTPPEDYKAQYRIDGGAWKDCYVTYNGMTYLYGVRYSDITGIDTSLGLRLCDADGTVLKTIPDLPTISDGEAAIRYWIQADPEMIVFDATDNEVLQTVQCTITIWKQVGQEAAVPTTEGKVTRQSDNTTTETELSPTGNSYIFNFAALLGIGPQDQTIRLYIDDVEVASKRVTIYRDPGKTCVLRISEWVEGVTYRNDNNRVFLPESEGAQKFLDIAVVTKSATSFDAYLCLATHTASSANKPGSGESWQTYWQKFNNMAPIYTPLIMAQNALLRFTQTNQLLVMKSDGTTVAAGMGGGNFPIWAGAANAANAPFRVGIDGKLYSTNAEIIGDIMSKSGRFIGGIGNPYNINSGSSIQFPDFKTGSNIIISTSQQAAGGVMLPLNVGNESDLNGLEIDIINVSPTNTVIMLPTFYEGNSNVNPHLYLQNKILRSIILSGNGHRARLKAFQWYPVQTQGLSWTILNPAEFTLKGIGDSDCSAVSRSVTAARNQGLVINISGRQTSAIYYPNFADISDYTEIILSKNTWTSTTANRVEVPCHEYSGFKDADGNNVNLTNWNISTIVMALITKPAISYNMPVFDFKLRAGQRVSLFHGISSSHSNSLLSAFQVYVNGGRLITIEKGTLHILANAGGFTAPSPSSSWGEGNYIAGNTHDWD